MVRLSWLFRLKVGWILILAGHILILLVAKTPMFFWLGSLRLSDDSRQVDKLTNQWKEFYEGRWVTVAFSVDKLAW